MKRLRQLNLKRYGKEARLKKCSYCGTEVRSGNDKMHSGCVAEEGRRLQQVFRLQFSRP